LLPATALLLLVSPGAKAISAVAKKKTSKRSTVAVRRRAAIRPKLNYAPVGHYDPTSGDHFEGEDPEVRRAAVEALGSRTGSIVVSDASTGRVLTMVNQKMALKHGFTPCSTIKIPVALAALTESLVERETPVRLSRQGRATMMMTEAIAHSNNEYFARLGERLGFEKVSYYAKLYGLGEKAALDLDAEQPGTLESQPSGAVGVMTSYGLGITLTPLQYAAIMGMVANGGTLYYMQYPKSPREAEALVPRVKRTLDLDSQIDAVRPGMMAAVEYGTARLAGFDPNEPVYAKTGTCTDAQTYQHLGWFGSFAQKGQRKLVVVVMLAGERSYSGSVASAVGGQVYKGLESQGYFTKAQPVSPLAMVGN
jgi:cell division protein FtsI/penicillin-binding protein 2